GDAEQLEPARLVVRERPRVVEIARVHPYSLRAHVPCAADRGRQQLPAQPLSDEAWKQAEGDELHVPLVLQLELEVSRGRPRDVRHPGLELGAIEIRKP